MGETEQQSFKESIQSPEEVLNAVNLTPERVKGKSVLYFGPEPLLVDEASIIPGSLEAFLTFDRLLPSGKTVDFVLGVNDDYLDGDIEDVDRVDLLEAAVRSLNQTGELRIANPYLAPTEHETASDIEALYEHALYDRDIDIKASYERGNDEYNSLLIIQRVFQEGNK